MKPTQAGFSMPEVLVASFILIWVILSSLQLTSSSILGMGKSKRRGLVDAAIASRIEKLRSDAFSYLCTPAAAIMS
jgi:Tfp pilus assembly protein PilV